MTIKPLISLLILVLSSLSLNAQDSTKTSRWRAFITNISMNYTPMEATYFEELIATDIPYATLRPTYMGASGSYLFGRLYTHLGALQGQGKKTETDTLTSRATQTHLMFNLGVSPIMTEKVIMSVYGGVRHTKLRHVTDDNAKFRFWKWHHLNAPHRLMVRRITIPVGAQVSVKLGDLINARLYAEYQFPINYVRTTSKNVITNANVPSPIGSFNAGIGLDFTWNPFI